MEKEGRDMPDPGGGCGRVDTCVGGSVSEHKSNALVHNDGCDDGQITTAGGRDESGTTRGTTACTSTSVNPSFDGLLCLAAASDSVAMSVYPVGTVATLLVDDGKLSFEVKVTGADYEANPPTNEVEYVLASNPDTKITKSVPASFIFKHQVSLELPSSDKSCGNDGEDSREGSKGSEGGVAKTDMNQAEGTEDSDKLSSGDAIPSRDDATDRTSTSSNGAKTVASITDTPPLAPERSQGKSFSPISERGDVKTLEEGKAPKDISSENVQKRPSKRAAAQKILSYKEKSDIDDKKNTNDPAKKSNGSSKATTMNGVLRMRLPGSDHDRDAVIACADFVQGVLKRKNCVNTNNCMSTTCTCMKAFDANLVNPVATFVATTWYRMSASEKVKHVVRVVQKKKQDKKDLHLPFRVTDIIQVKKLSSQKFICKNAMCELLGITKTLWEKIVDALIDEFDAPGSKSVAVDNSQRGRLFSGKKTGSINRRAVGVSLSSNLAIKAKSRVVLESERASANDIPPAVVSFDEKRNERKSRTNPKCKIQGCDKYRQSKCDNMCAAHFREAKEASEGGEATGTEVPRKSIKTSGGGWICRRCDRENDADKKRCPGCYGWRGGTMDGIRAAAPKRAKTGDFRSTGISENDLKKTAADAAEAAIIALSTSARVADASVKEKAPNDGVSEIQSTEPAMEESIPEPDVWNCHLCDLENGAEKRRCAGCMGWRGGKKLAPGAVSKPKYDSTKCIVKGCEKHRQHKCNKMCMAHFQEELRRCEGGTKRKRSSSTAGTGDESPSTINALLKQYKQKEATNTPDAIIGACVSFIQTQLMTKACTNRHNGISSKCTCIKTLDPALVRPVSSYIVSTWDRMNEDAKISQILKWYQNEAAGGDLPYTLPISHVNDSILETKQVCRHGLFEVLGVSRRLWEKAMLARKASENETQEDDAEEAFEAPQRLLKRTAAQVAVSKLAAGDQTDTEDECDEDMDASVDENADLLVPEIVKGTSIYKYFAEGKSYYEGKITKVPGPGTSFYHVRYDDGDEEDLEPHEMWIAFSDWCIANNEIELTQFHPKQNVYAFDRTKVKRDAVIKSFRPVQREGSDQWSWSYLVHFLGWNSRHDEWVGEHYIEIRATGPEEEKVEEESEAGEEIDLGTPTRKRNIDPDLFISPNKRQRWCCHRCDTINGPDGTSCSHCNCEKDDEAESESEEEDNEESEVEMMDVLSESFTAARKKKCAVEGCSVTSSDNGESDDDDEENRGSNGNYLCSAVDCDKYRQSGRGGMCCSHYSEAQNKSNELKDKNFGSDSEEEFEDNEEVGFGLKNDEASYVRCPKEKQCIIDGCTRWRHGWQNICLKHQCEARIARTHGTDDDGEETEENEWTDSEEGGSSPNALGTVSDNTSFRSGYWSESGKECRRGNNNESTNDEVEAEDVGMVEEPASIEAVVPDAATADEIASNTTEAVAAKTSNDDLMRAVPEPRAVGHEGASFQAVLELLKDSDDEEDDEDLFG